MGNWGDFTLPGNPFGTLFLPLNSEANILAEG